MAGSEGQEPLGPGAGELLGPQVPGTTTLVYGSYPPVPGLAARVTQSEVTAAWEAGEVVTVVSPRPSAAHMALRISGPLSGHRLRDLRREVGAARLVFCAEPQVPLSLGGPRLLRQVQHALTVRALARAFAEFEHVTLAVTGDLGASKAVLDPLRRAAQEVHDQIAPEVQNRVGADRLAHLGQPVSPLGPDEMLWQDRVRRAIRIVARRVLGSRATGMGARAEIAEAEIRRALQRAARRLRAGDPPA